jgi:hypothetical protein
MTAIRAEIARVQDGHQPDKLVHAPAPRTT